MRFLRPLLLWASLVSVLPAAPIQLWSQGEPSADEQDALEWLNRARADPNGALALLLAAGPADPVLTSCLAGLLPQTPAQLTAGLAAAYAAAVAGSARFPSSAAISQEPLALYPLFMERAAALSSSAMVPPPVFSAGRLPPDYFPPVPTAGTLYSGPGQTLAGPNATGGTARFGPVGGNYSEGTVANLYDPLLGPREWILGWLCAPGTGSPPPAFLAQGDSLPDLTLAHTRLAGIAIAPTGTSGRTLAFFRGGNEFFTASDLPFGAAGTVFITGVAYRDQNRNGRYDSGEGISGLSLALNRTNWGATTAAAGGYAIPVAANSGSYVVTAQGPGFGPLRAAVSVGAESVKLDWTVPAAAAAALPQVPVAGSTGDCRLINLSTRGRIEFGGSALVGGFIVAGPPAARETLLLRGIGPSLSTVGLPATECIPATALQLYSGGAVIASNSGWTAGLDGGAAASQTAARTGAFPLTNWAGGGGDSALVITLAPGSYSVVVSPAAGLPAVYTTGRLGLVEIYEAASAGGAQLANLSSRGLMGTGDGQLVIGATLAGTGRQRLLVRAAGPALGQSFGLAPALADPVLTLYAQNGAALAANDDWSNSAQTDQMRALSVAVGAFPYPEGGTDAALLALLPAGQYSARLGAKPGTVPGGLALVEIYAAP